MQSFKQLDVASQQPKRTIGKWKLCRHKVKKMLQQLKLHQEALDPAEAALRQQEESLSEGPDFKGKFPLTRWEKLVLHHKGTDKQPGPYAGKAFLPRRGYFACKQCGMPLYLAAAKFVHGGKCSAFDQNIAGAITLTPETDGRIETSCAHCGGHLGHVFSREQNSGRTGQRHCTNDSSIQYVLADLPRFMREQGRLLI
mmetsp:Transcript_27799/g.50773  ORF Transcript_27799/g.50773 Transcript_27799/m.50773 type:complete len:198 (-) Transcript_27799:74-667(-)